MIKDIFLDKSQAFYHVKITFTIADNEIAFDNGITFVKIYFYNNFFGIATLLIEFIRSNNILVYNREYRKDLFIQYKNNICVENSKILGVEDIKLICNYIEKYILYGGII